MKHERKLTAKMEKFVENFVCSGNATESARVAGYSEKSIDATAARLLENVRIKTAIREKVDAVESSKIAKPKEILETLTSILRGQMTEKVICAVNQGRGVVNELMERPPLIRDRLTAAQILSRILQLDKPADIKQEVQIYIPANGREIENPLFKG